MSATGSTSSRGTHSKSPSRSRSPPFSDGRYPPQFPSRYDSYGYRPRSGMTAAIDDYWELRDRERDRERERERERERDCSKLVMRDDRYMRGRDTRYSPYYRDEPPPPPPLPPHHYGPSNLPRDFSKPSSCTSLRREGSAERSSPISTKSKEDKSIIPSDSYTSRYADWRERERDWDRDRRYRDDDRRRDFDRRNRNRDGYGMRDSRYDSPGYTGGPPATSGYPPAPFGRDSYRPGGGSGSGSGGRDREPSSPGGAYPYYDRDSRDRFEDRDFYRPMSRGSSIEFDRYRNRPSRPTTAASGGNIIADRNTPGWRPTSRERDRERDATGKLAYGTMGPTSSSSSKDDSKSTDTKLDDYDTGDHGSDYSIPGDSVKLELSATKLGPSQQEVISGKEKDDETKTMDSFKADDNQDGTFDQRNIMTSHQAMETNDKDALHVDTSPDNNLRNESMDIDAPTPSSASPPLSSRSATSIVLPSSNSLSTEPIDSLGSVIISSTAPSAPASVPVSLEIESSKTLPANSEHLSPMTQVDSTKTEDTSSTTTAASTQVKIESDLLATDSSILTLNEPPHQRSSSSPPPSSSAMDDSKENTEPVLASKIKSETVLSQQQIVSRIDEIENDITKYETMLEQINKREADSKNLAPQQHEDEERQQQESISLKLEPSALDTKDEDDDDDTEEEAAKKQALKVISEGSQPMTDIQNIPFNDSTIMRRRPQLLMDQIRTNGDNDEEALSALIISDNQRLARANATMMGGWQGEPDDGRDWSDEAKWSAPLYDKLQDYPCYKRNIARLNKLKVPMASYLAYRRKQLKQKERRLKREFKEIHNQWKNKNMALDRMRAQERRGSDRYGSSGGGGYRSSTRRSRGGVEEEPEEYVDGVIFTGNHDALRFSEDGAMTPFGRGGGKGAWTSDAARSEAELLEIIQSLESAEMRNPELRAKKTTATIPPMILDVKERARTYDDRSGLVENPLVYYHTGNETEDTWTPQEMTTFMESYMQYPKQFEKVAAAVGTKTASQCVLFYYRKKTKIDFKALMRKGKRGKNRRRERLAAAIKRATGDTSASARKGKSKGSALMADIGQAQVSRKAKEQSETKTKELRELEEGNMYWESVAERRKSKRPASNSSATNRSAASNDDSGAIGYGDTGVKRKLGKRKGRSPRPSVTSIQDTDLVFPDEPMDDVPPVKSTTKSDKLLQQVQQSQSRSSTTTYNSNSLENNEQPDTNPSNTTTAKWTDKDKYAAVEAFKLLGRDFIKVSEKVGSKTDDQCRNFYFNHKRKYGPNAFGEEDSDYSGTPDMVASPPTTASKSMTTNPSMASGSSISNTLMTEGSRSTGLKAEEEDAAAALVGLFQMGGNRDYRMDATPSPSLSPSVSSPKISLMAGEATSGLPSQQSSTQSKGRRRARTVSGKMDSAGTNEEWSGIGAGDDASPALRGNNAAASGGKRTASEVTKRGTNSSYWSVSERGEFVHHLETFGRDWARIANAMKSKTAIQVRNFYQNNEEKMQLDQVVHRREGGIPSLSTAAPTTNSHYTSNKSEHPQIMPPMGTSFDDHLPPSAARLPSTTQPFNKSVDSPMYHPPAGPRSGYFNPSSTRSTESGSMDYATPYDTDRPASYLTPYNNNSPATEVHHLNGPQRYHHPSDTSNHNPMDVASANSPTGVTRVSDLLNSNDEPAETNNQNSWETWFGS
ncbi:unnamed protein product [Absidia cylindrospora]